MVEYTRLIECRVFDGRYTYGHGGRQTSQPRNSRLNLTPHIYKQCGNESGLVDFIASTDKNGCSFSYIIVYVDFARQIVLR